MRKKRKQKRKDKVVMETTVMDTKICALIDSLWSDARHRIYWQAKEAQNQIIRRISGEKS